MKSPALGHVHERIIALATPFYPAYLVRGETHTLVIDSGVNLVGPRYLAEIARESEKAALPTYLLLTHSHYDHVGAASYLQQHLPGLKIAAHERVAGLVQKPSALDTMNRLSASHTELLDFNPAGEDLALRPFSIDMLLRHGDEIGLGGLTCRVYETPGHTRDSLAFYFPEIGALFPGDACGVLRDGAGTELQVEFVSSYQDYVESLRFMTALKPEILCLAHHWVLTGEDATQLMERSLAETFRYRELIETHLDAAGGDVDEAIRRLVHAEYDTKEGILQQRTAYLTNLTAQVKHIAVCRTSEGA